VLVVLLVLAVTFPILGSTTVQQQNKARVPRVPLGTPAWPIFLARYGINPVNP